MNESFGVHVPVLGIRDLTSRFATPFFGESDKITLYSENFRKNKKSINNLIYRVNYSAERVMKSKIDSDTVKRAVFRCCGLRGASLAAFVLWFK